MKSKIIWFTGLSGSGKTTLSNYIFKKLKNKKFIELSQLNKFVESLEEGIYSKVGDRAFRISGGQKQRIGIARALYRNPKILIMDESTNSLDEQTEQSFLKDIKIISKELITIFITHKIKNLNYCDVIYKLENGKLN